MLPDRPLSAIRRLVLVTGATGYVGARLVGRLLGQGYRVRVLVRDLRRLHSRPWLNRVEVCEGDALKPETLPQALRDVHTAYYLIHSMAHGEGFVERDISAARHFGEAARAARLSRIIYLGGLGDPGSDLSDHLRSRHLTGDMLRESGIPVTEFRAAVIVGSGSLSFEMIRYLTERMPVLFCAKWGFTRVQPISMRNVLQYLVAALWTPASIGQIIEIGGAEVLTYLEMMLGYAEERGLFRQRLTLPFLPVWFCANVVNLLTPVPREMAYALIESLHNEVVVRDPRALTIFPDIRPYDYRTAVSRALMRLDQGDVESAWSDALFSTLGDQRPVMLTTQEGMIIEQRQRVVEAPAEDVFHVFSSLGGRQGWLYLNWAWIARGVIDRVLGGVGVIRGRRFADHVRVGDALDFWRVEDVAEGRMMRLRAEMKVPGSAWLQFDAQPLGGRRTRLRQVAYFAPKGLLGLLYWYTLYPVHALLFSGLVRRIAERAEALARGSRYSRAAG